MRDIFGIRVEKLTTLEEFWAVYDEPDSHVVLRTESIFLTRLWLSHWWQIYGHDYQVHALVAREEQKLIGMFPLALRNAPGGIRHLTFMGAGELTPNDLDILSAHEKKSQVLQAFAAYLFETSSEWDIIELDKLLAGSLTIEVFEAYFRSRRRFTDLRLSACCFAIKLPRTIDEYFSYLSRSMRHNIKRRRRNLQKDFPDTEFVRASTPEQVQRAFEALVCLSQTRWMGRGYPGVFSSQRFYEFHRALALHALQSNLSCICYLQINGEIVAVEYIFCVGGVVQDYLGGFHDAWSKYGIGNLLVVYAIQTAIQNGAQVFDFLEGDEIYKQDWATEVRENYVLRLYGASWRSQLEYIKLRLIESTKQLLIRYVPENIRRPLWKLFLRISVYLQKDTQAA